MRGHRGGMVVASVGALVACLLTSACTSVQEREREVATDRQATSDDIIDAGQVADVAATSRQMVVTWEVEPDDRDGPAQGAWRLYDRDRGPVADGTFGKVDEANARIDALPMRGGFLLTDHAKNQQHFLKPDGRLAPARLTRASAGSSLKGGVLVSDGERPGQSVVIPQQNRVVPLPPLPVAEARRVALTHDGTVWVLMPRSSAEQPARIAHAKNGQAPWTTERVPLHQGSSASGLSASGNRIFVVSERVNDDRTSVDAILARQSGATGWSRLPARGIAGDLRHAPTIDVVRTPRNKARLVVKSGEGDWVQQADGTFVAIRPPGTPKGTRPDVTVEGQWLWASNGRSGNALHYSYNFGRTWDEFDR